MKITTDKKAIDRTFSIEQESLVILITKDNVSRDDIYLKLENKFIAQQTRLIMLRKQEILEK